MTDDQHDTIESELWEALGHPPLHDHDPDVEQAPDLESLIGLVAKRVKFSPVIAEIVKERERQIGKGYNAAHDDDQDPERLSDIAAMLIYSGEIYQPDPELWSVVEHIDDKHRSPRDQLVIAAAMIIAEIERGDRANATPYEPPGEDDHDSR